MEQLFKKIRPRRLELSNKRTIIESGKELEMAPRRNMVGSANDCFQTRMRIIDIVHLKNEHKLCGPVALRQSNRGVGLHRLKIKIEIRKRTIQLCA